MKMEEKKLRIGLVGTSSRCHSLHESYHLHPQYEVVAACDTALHKQVADALGVVESGGSPHFAW